MPAGLIVLVIVVGISLLITVASNWLRSQQRQAEAQAADRRARNRSASTGGAAKTGAGDIDRFLEEINKLRQKPVSVEPAASPKKAKPAPVARRVDPPPVAQPVPRFEELPVAPVVARPLAPPPPPAGASRPPVMKPAQEAAPATPFARQFVGLLGNPRSLPMVMVLQEVLGPPRCKRPR